MDNRRQSTAPTLGLVPPNQTGGIGGMGGIGGGGAGGRKQSVMMMDISQLSPSARKQSMMIANGQITIKLSKTSTARPFLRNKEHRDGLLTRLADIIEDGHAQQRTGELETKGKLPIEAAYKVMKRITEAAKIPVLPAGMSTFNKLESLRTDPAVKVLTSTTWKEFFSKPKPGNDQKGNLNAHSLYSTIQATPSQFANTGHSSDKHGMMDGNNIGGDLGMIEEDDPMLDILFESLILRVNILWREVKIPVKEQQFYRKSLCKRPIQNIDQCKELAGYIEKLEEHKFLIKQVLKQIQIRETALKKCYDVLVALHRKFASGNSSHSSASTKTLNIAGNVFWKEELILSLDEVRCASLEVIKHIQLWRRMMWRPHAFYYKGVNYLLKMKEDMKLLESEVFRKVLEQVPLQMEDLQCIIFNVNYQHGNSNTQHYNKYGYRSKSFRSQYPPDSPEAYMENLVNDFQSNIEKDELQAASAVVLEEEMLQQALSTEKEALQLKGVFIPLLRPNSNSSQQNNNNNTNTTISTQPSQPRHTPYNPPYNASATPSSFTPYQPQASPSTPYQSVPNYQNNQAQVSNYAPYNNTSSSHVHQTTPFHTSKSLNSQESFRNLQNETIEEQEEHEDDAPLKKSPAENKEEIDDHHDDNKPHAKEISPRPVRHAQDEPEVSVEPTAARVPMDELAHK